jgi:hypothetical protein
MVIFLIPTGCSRSYSHFLAEGMRFIGAGVLLAAEIEVAEKRLGR